MTQALTCTTIKYTHLDTAVKLKVVGVRTQDSESPNEDLIFLTDTRSDQTRASAWNLPHTSLSATIWGVRQEFPKGNHVFAALMYLYSPGADGFTTDNRTQGLMYPIAWLPPTCGHQINL